MTLFKMAGKKWQPFTIFAQTIIHLVCPPKFCITILSNFSWVLQSSREKSKTMIMKIWGVKQAALWSFWKWCMKSFQISDEMGKLCSLVKYGKIECPSF